MCARHDLTGSGKEREREREEREREEREREERERENGGIYDATDLRKKEQGGSTTSDLEMEPNAAGPLRDPKMRSSKYQCSTVEKLASTTLLS